MALLFDKPPAAMASDGGGGATKPAMHPFFVSRDRATQKQPFADEARDISPKVQGRKEEDNIHKGEQSLQDAGPPTIATMTVIPPYEATTGSLPPLPGQEAVQREDNGLLQSTGNTMSSANSALPPLPGLHADAYYQTPAGDPDFAENEDRRKRRRTSPLPEIQVPCSDPPHQTPEPSPPQISLVSSQSSVPQHPEHAASIDKEQIGLDNAEKETPGPQVSGKVDTEVSKPKTPPKKMITLRMDGRLASPKEVKEPAKRGRKRKSAEAPKKEKIVLVRYGIEEKGALVGNEIAKILSGESRFSKPAPKVVQREQPKGPPKVTHPFFTGKLQRPALKDQGKFSEREVDSGTDGAVTPKKKKKTSLLPAASSWAGFGASFSKPAKQAGTIDAPWPPQGMIHCRGFESVSQEAKRSVDAEKKLKGTEVLVREDEDVLSACKKLVTLVKEKSPPKVFTKPTRRLMTGKELQAAIRHQLRSRIEALPAPEEEAEDLGTGYSELGKTHAAIQTLYYDLKTSLSAFDRFECENSDWMHKYMPKRATEVLQDTNRMLLLRDWLNGLAVNSVDSGNSSKPHISAELARKMRAKAKKRRKRGDGLDDFIAGSVEDEWDTDGVPDLESELADLGPGQTARDHSSCLIRKLSPSNLNKTRAVVLSGPHGSGKTASVYAVARELDFEVFEINAGSRRSGRDVQDRVGDMTKNHLVRNRAGEDKKADLSDAPNDTDGGKSSVMNAFIKKEPKKRGRPPKVAERKTPEPSKKSKAQRQSLILLEDVDVLFEEDRQFWAAIFNLLFSSRRPIIMTCTNEALLPSVDDLSFTSILHLSPPPEDLVADHLLLVAANEGHLLSRNAVLALYRAKGFDFRASLTQMQFACQMAIGDEKGGLDWMLLKHNGDEGVNENGEPLRVVSEGTMTENLGCMAQGDDAERFEVVDASTQIPNSIDRETNLLENAHDAVGFDMESWMASGRMVVDTKQMADPRHKNLSALDDFVQTFDALSVADILPGSFSFYSSGPSILDHKHTKQDPTIPEFSEKVLADTTEGLPLLHSEPEPTSRLSTSIPLALQLLSQSAISCASQPMKLPPVTPPNLVTCAARSTSLHTRLIDSDWSLSDSLHPLSVPRSGPTQSMLMGLTGVPLSSGFLVPQPSAEPSPSAAIFDSRPGILAVEIAPFVRGIAAFDLALAKRRDEMSGVDPNGAGEGPDGSGRKKFVRKTRAARAALEGGGRASTRRERWFGEGLSLHNVLATVPEEWRTLCDDEWRKRVEMAEEQREVEIQEQGNTGEMEVDGAEVQDGASGGQSLTNDKTHPLQPIRLEDISDDELSSRRA